MHLEWTSELSVGNELIDGQHKELFRRINLLGEAVQQSSPKEEFQKVLSFLEEYIESHFGMEENYMKTLNYMKYSEHLLQHAIFRYLIADVKKRTDEKGPTWELIILIKTKLSDWLRRHISVMDKELALYLQEESMVNGKHGI